MLSAQRVASDGTTTMVKSESEGESLQVIVDKYRNRGSKDGIVGEGADILSLWKSAHVATRTLDSGSAECRSLSLDAGGRRDSEGWMGHRPGC